MALHGASRDDLECAICLELLCDPLLLPCRHAFCRRCLGLAFSGARRCPLCRTPAPEFDPALQPVDTPLREVLVRTCTVEYEQRLEDLAFEAARLIRLRISNDCDLLSIVPRPSFQWTLKVELEPEEDTALPEGAALPDIIERIRFGLVPACKLKSYGDTLCEPVAGAAPSFVEVTSGGSFQVTACNSLPFTVPIVIMWKEWLGQLPLRLEHELSFQREGGSWSYGVDLGAALLAGPLASAPDAAGRSAPTELRYSPAVASATAAEPMPAPRLSRWRRIQSIGARSRLGRLLRL